LTVARGFGARCAARDIRVIYGGAKVGLLGALADGALAAGGEVVGVLPRVLAPREVAHNGLTELHLVDNLHVRKALMLDKADACVALPGGIGTFDELFEAWTWRYLGIHQKPVGILDAAGFYEHLVRFLDAVRDSGLVAATTCDMLAVRREADELLDALEQMT
jgi:hypothetical protein